MQIFLHFFGHLAQICSVIWRKFVRSFGVNPLRSPLAASSTRSSPARQASRLANGVIAKGGEVNG